MNLKTIALSLFLGLILLGAPLVRYGFVQDGTTTPTTEYSVNISPATATKTGQPGAEVTYTLTIINTGNVEINILMDYSGLSGWPVKIIPENIDNLLPKKATQVEVSITIPDGQQAGSTEVTTISFYSEVGKLAEAILTTNAGSNRPLLALESYSISGNGAIQPGQKFDLHLKVVNTGKGFARNIVLTFSSTDLLPLDTGGVITYNEMDPGEKVEFVQPLLASSTLLGQKVATTTVAVSYSDFDGVGYTANFTLTININQPGSSGVSRPTATPTPVSRPQLVVSGYATDVDPLQPGTIFSLDLDIRNLGTSDARSVTMVLGGGASSGDGGQGTPSPGGVSGAGADTSVFAPLGSSNLVYLGDVPVDVTVQSSQKLIVNTSANPGAYAFKISFVYDDAKGNRQVNDQIITLLVYQLPQIEINYYRDPGMFMLGQPNMLPLQVTNLGRKTAVLGNMRVSSPNAEVTNNVTLVGVLDPGGYYTLDANVTPMQPGPLELLVEVNYTDDFNQPRTISQTLTVEVMEMPTPESFPPEGIPPDGEMPPTTQETGWQKFIRFIKGMLGLGSQQPSTSPEPIIIPEGETPEVKPPVIINPGGKG